MVVPTTTEPKETDVTPGNLRSALLVAVLMAAGSAYAQSVPATGAAAAKGGPALVAPPNSTPAQPAASGSTPPPSVPLPGQSTLGNSLPPTATLPPITPAAGLANAPLPGTVPSRSDTAATAFRSLDSGNRGFVTKADTDRIPGFLGFDNADTNRDGQLDATEFANAWKFYSGQ